MFAMAVICWWVGPNIVLRSKWAASLRVQGPEKGIKLISNNLQVKVKENMAHFIWSFIKVKTQFIGNKKNDLGSIETRIKKDWQPIYILVRTKYRICIVTHIYNKS